MVSLHAKSSSGCCNSSFLCMLCADVLMCPCDSHAHIPHSPHGIFQPVPSALRPDAWLRSPHEFHPEDVESTSLMLPLFRPPSAWTRPWRWTRRREHKTPCSLRGHYSTRLTASNYFVLHTRSSFHHFALQIVDSRFEKFFSFQV